MHNVVTSKDEVLYIKKNMVIYMYKHHSKYVAKTKSDSFLCHFMSYDLLYYERGTNLPHFVKKSCTFKNNVSF